MTDSVADYELVEPLTPTAQAERYLAVPPERLGLTARHVDLTVVPVDATSAQFRRVTNELRLLHSLRCAHLVEVLDAGSADGRLFFATRHYPAGDLASPAGAPPLLRQVAAVAGAARGAEAMHDAGVAHRNINPGNIVLDGMSGRLGGLGLAEMAAGTTATVGVGPLGTLQFVDPALIRGGPATRLTDVWSLGVTLHCVASNRPLFGAIPTHSLLAAFRHVANEPAHVDGRIDADLAVVITHCLAPEADRFHRAVAVADALDAITTLGGTPPSPSDNLVRLRPQEP